jgi:uncharacterized protein YdbL (DUF1318 family)
MSSFDLTRRRLLGLAAGAAAMIVMPGLAFAQGLDEARQLGYLGERPDGYLAQRAGDAPSWALELMESINSQRELKYKELALKNGTSLEAVQVVAGEKIIENLPAGAYYMDASGTWMQK